MFTVKGIYKDGQIRLLEPVPAEINEPQEVTVTFAEPLADNDRRNSEAVTAALSIIGLLDDLSPEQLADFEAAVARRSPFFGPREITW